MTEDQFWKIIELTKSDDPGTQISTLMAKLEKQVPEKIFAFQTIYQTLLDRAYRWDLWGAAYVKIGGCSDDGFDYFCDWLISRGRTVYEAVLDDPQRLADTDLSGDSDMEAFRYVAYEAFQAKTGREMDVPPSAVGDPMGEPFDENTVDQLYPRLAGEQRTSDDAPQNPQENEKELEFLLTELVGKRLTSVVPLETPGPFKKNAGMAFYFSLGRPRIEAKAWTIETAEKNLSTLELVEAEIREAQPIDEPSISKEKAEIAAATQQLFSVSGDIRVTVETAQLVGQGDLRITFANAPSLHAVVLHSFRGNASNAAILVKYDNDHYYLSPNEIRKQRER